MVARYDALIRAKSPTNCDAHLAESLFQTRSSAETMGFISGGVCVSRHSGFVNLYSHCPRMILLI
ncbi:MAG: DUF6783 domain-containing protein [Blautia faecis]